MAPGAVYVVADPGAWGPIAVTAYFFDGADSVRVAVNRTAVQLTFLSSWRLGSSRDAISMSVEFNVSYSS